MTKRGKIGQDEPPGQPTAARRRRGTGCVFQREFVDPATGERRKYSTWSVQYYDQLGRRQREHGIPTAAQAERKLRDRLAAKDEGRASGPAVERTTYEDLEQMVVDDYEANAHRSLKRLRQALVHLKAFFRSERAVRITEDRVTAYIAARRREKAANASINYELAVLKRAFRLAARAGRVGRRPDIVQLRVDNARKGFFEEPDFRRVLQQLPGPLKPVAIVAYYTGWRVSSEILTRQWKDLDLDAGWLRLEPGEAKGPRQRRGRQFPLAVAPELRATFEELKRQNDTLRREGRITPWVFIRVTKTRKSGKVHVKPIRHFRSAWVTACANAGFGTIVRDREGRIVKKTATRIPHDFRRTAVRNLERAGVPRSTAMALVGHQTEVIYRRYAISDEASLLEGAAKMAAWISGRAKVDEPAKQ